MNKQSLSQQMRVVHKGARLLGCDFTRCDKRFSINQTDLQNHMRLGHNYPKLRVVSNKGTKSEMSLLNIIQLCAQFCPWPLCNFNIIVGFTEINI